MINTFRLALCQTRCTPSKQQNINFIREALTTAGKSGANVSILGQICNSPYMRQDMIKNAENFNQSPTLQSIQEVCKDQKMYAIGTISRKLNEKIFNTAFVINGKGELATQYDKLHLFDIDIPGKITYKESDAITRGEKMCVFDTEYGRFGLGICYDMRFPELALAMCKKGAKFLVYPGSFNQTTGPLHWQLLLRSRGLDNLCFAAGVSVAQYKEDPNSYQAWGHSTLVDPFGKVLVGLDENPGIEYHDIDMTKVDEARGQIPVYNQKRYDIYTLDSK